MIEIPESVKKIHEAQAPSITDETLSKHYTKRKEEKEKELSRVGVVLKSPRIIIVMIIIILFLLLFFKHQPDRHSEKEEIGFLA